MPKAGTGWLYDQLDAHPDFWMPPVKELVYLNQSYPALAFVNDSGDAVRPRKERLARRRGTSPETRSPTGERRVHRDPLSERDVKFLRYASTGRGKPMDLEFYAGLFWFSGKQLSGDITPPYCNIESDTVRHVAQRFPKAKILLLVRDPVARVWSRICMSYAGKGFDTGLLNDATAFRAYIERNHKLGGLSGTQTWQRWQQHAPDMERKFFFFDDLASEPERLRRDVLLFLGGDPRGKSDSIGPDYNRKAKAKLEMTPLAREVLVDWFKVELLASAEAFGGPARDWPALYGV
jgi:hypothetical protein